MEVSNVEALCAEWLDAKRAEMEANKRRQKVEVEIAQAFDVPDEGSKTHSTENYKVRLSQPFYRKVDPEAWGEVKGRVSPDFWPVKEKIEADATGIKWLIENEPKVWAAIADAFETKPGKVSVKVEEV